MPQAAPDTARGEQFAELFEKVGLNPEYMHDFIVAMESVLMKNVTAQIESFRKEVLARFSIQDERTADLIDKVGAAEADNEKGFDTLCGKIDSMEANGNEEFDRLSYKIDQGFKALNDKFDDKFDTLIKEIAETNARIDRWDKRFWMLFVLIVGAILTGFAAIIVQPLL